MNCLLWPALAFFVFYKGYYALCLGTNHAVALKVYYVTQVVQCVFFLYFTFTRSGAWNGFAKLPVLANCGLGFSVFLAVIEIIADIIVLGLSVFCLWKTKNLYDPKAETYQQENK
jgi:hypothetical protein